MRFGGVYVATVGRWDKDCAARVSSLANEEPLVVVKTGVDIVREVVRKDCGDSRDGVIGERETSLCRGRCGSVSQRTSGVEDRHIGCDRSVGGHRGSEVFASGGSDEDVIGVDGNILMEWGKEEGVEDLLGDPGRSGRHGQWGETIEVVSLLYLSSSGLSSGHARMVLIEVCDQVWSGHLRL